MKLYNPGCVVLVVIVVILLAIIGSCSSSSSSSHKDIKDMTNKEYNDFMKWDAEQNRKKWENQKPFK